MKHSAYGESDMQPIFFNSSDYAFGPRNWSYRVTLPFFVEDLTPVPRFDMPEGEWYENEYCGH